MISAREFCREPGYPVALFLTYSFDPLFFERIPLGDLDKGGGRRILIVADAGQVREAMRQSIRQLAYLGRRYVLAETVTPNTFHPKLIARLSPTAGRVWVSSGNLTFTGWGGNQEIATVWPIGPREEDKGAWLPQLLDAVGRVVKSGAFTTQVEAIYDAVGWLTAAHPSTDAGHVLFGTPDRPLGPQLAERWKNRKFDELKLCTGSTDEDGAFLLWAHRTFGIKRATVCVSPAFAAFEPARLANLPMKVWIIKARPDQLMHAKFYWFTGPNGPAAVAGSANCSSAAWLAGGGFGNFELIVPYDTPSKAEFSSILSIFKGQSLPPENALTVRPPQPSDGEAEQAETFHIVSLRLRSTGRIVEAIIEPPVPEGSQVDLTIEGSSRRTTIRLVRHPRSLTGHLPPEFEIGPGTAFACASIDTGFQKLVTSPRWIDNEAALARASSDALVEPGLLDLSRRSVANSDRQKILEAISAVSSKLLRGDGAAQTLASAARRSAQAQQKEGEADEPKARAVDPAAIIRSLKELAAERQAKGQASFGSYGATLEGVIAMLFSNDEEEQDIDLSREAWMGDNPEQVSAEPGDIRGNLDSHDSEDTPPPAETSAETAARFHGQLDEFLRELGRPEFAEGCDSARLVQALAFPLLVCVRGNEVGCVSRTTLASVATRVAEIMFTKSYGAGKPQGLFRQVKHRYAALGREDDFLRAVGEGTLWSALLASLATSEDAPLRNLIPQAAALIAVFACKDLVAFATAEQLARLVQNLVIIDAELVLSTKVAEIVDALFELMALLGQHEEEVYKQHGNGRRLQNGGSVLWSSKWGWSVLPGIPAQVYCSGLINVDSAAKENAAIQQALASLRRAMNGEI